MAEILAMCKTQQARANNGGMKIVKGAPCLNDVVQMHVADGTFIDLEWGAERVMYINNECTNH